MAAVPDLAGGELLRPSGNEADRSWTGTIRNYLLRFFITAKRNECPGYSDDAKAAESNLRKAKVPPRADVSPGIRGEPVTATGATTGQTFVNGVTVRAFSHFGSLC
jgi:hypothetical protein